MEKCKYCNGKGYSTVLYGTTISTDFIGDKIDSDIKIRLVACPKCNKNNKRRLKDVQKSYWDIK